ncbi:hypothetical protein A5881_003619 [Enterococcus termitis]
MTTKYEKANQKIKLNKTQRGILVDALQEEPNVYLQQIQFEIDTLYDKKTFETALSLILMKHTTLVSSIELVDNDFYFVPVFNINDILTTNEDSYESFQANQYNRTKKGFDLFTDSLFRVDLTLNNGFSYFSITFHQILLDGTSINNLINELFYAYASLLKNPEFKLKPEKITASEVAVIMESKPEKIEYVKEEPLFNNSQLSNIKTSTKIIYDQLELAEIESFCKSHRITLNSFIFTLYLYFIGRSIDNNVFTAGFAVDGRNPEIEGVYETLGCLIQTLLFETEELDFKSEVKPEIFSKVNSKLLNIISDCYEYNLNQTVIDFENSHLDSMYSFHNYEFNELAKNVVFKELNTTDILPYVINFTVIPTNNQLEMFLTYDSNIKGEDLIANIVDEARSIYIKESNEDSSVIEILEEILGESNISINQSIFELGVNSLSLAILYKKLKNKNVDLNFLDLIKAKTVKDIISLIKKKKR